MEEDARQLPPLNITVGWSIQGYITATVNDELKKIFVYEDELTPREIAEKFVERHGLAGDDPAAGEYTWSSLRAGERPHITTNTRIRTNTQ